MQDIRFEIKKLKGTGLLAGGILLTIAIVCFQGYAGLVTDGISKDIIHVTALDIFSAFLYPLLISAVAMRAFRVENLNEGFLNYYFNNISLKRLYYKKIITVNFIGIGYFAAALIISGCFIAGKGADPVAIYVHNWSFIVLFLLAGCTVINIMAILCMRLKSQLVPGVVALIAIIFQSLPNYMGLSFLNPWSYFEIALYHSGLNLLNICGMVTVFALSVISLLRVIRKIGTGWKG